MKKISIFLTIVMILGLFSNVFAAGIENNCENTDGAALVRAIAPSTITSVEKDGRTCLEIKTDSTQGVTGANDPYIVYEYPELKGRFYEFSIDMMIEDFMCDRNVIMWLNSETNAPILIRPVAFAKNGRIGYKNEGGGFVNFKTPFDYKTGQWYNVKVEIDTVNSSGNIYVDGVKMNEEQVVFNSKKAVGGIQRVRIVNQDAYNVIAKSYIDSFGLEERTEIENYIKPVEEIVLPLNDVENHTSAEVVFKLNELGIIEGYGNKDYRPEQNTAFDSFVKMVVKALDKNISNGDGYWAEPYISEALERGIIDESQTVNSERKITYKEIAQILSRALNEEPETNEEQYSKYIKNYSEIPAEYQDDILRTFAKGITSVDDNENFLYDSEVKRADAAEMLIRFLFASERPSVKYTVGIYGADSFKEVGEKISAAVSEDYVVTLLSDEDMENKNKLNANILDCVILLNKLSETDTAKATLKQFLYDGGDIVTAGSELFTKFNNSDWKLPIYEGYNYAPYDLKGTKKVVTAKEQKVIEETIEITAEDYFGGTSAVGFLFPNQSAFIPVLTAEDEYGQELGHAAGILTQFDGKYEGGKWLMFGIGDEAFYKNDSFSEVVFKCLERFRCGCIDGVYSKEEIKAKNLAELEKFEMTEPKPEGSVTVDRKTGKLIGLDGKELFLTAANTFGDAEYLLGMGQEEDGSFSIEKIENIFKIASESGVNCLRFWKLPTEGKRVDVIKNLARKYKIYIYAHIGVNPDREKDIQNIENYARAYGDEPMVIGYDLINEPQFNVIMTRFDGDESPLIQADIYGNCKEYMEKWKASYDWLDDDANLAYAGWYEYMSPELRKQLIAADVMYRKEIFEGQSSLSLTGIKIKDNLDKEAKIALDAMNKTIEKWIKTRKEIIRKYDPDALVTVGHYNQLNLFPANAELDFQNLHAYTYANSKEDMADALIAFDNLNAIFPTSPTMFGEFCYSGGQILKAGPHKGELTDFDIANAGELMHWLYAYSKGYSGAAIWALQEWNPSNYRFDNLSYGVWEPANGLRRERQGLLYYAGDKDAKYKRKPIASALKFFRGHIDNHKIGEGKFTLSDAENQANFGFVYESENSLYVANTSYKSDMLSFEAEGTPMVMADWSNGEIHLMATKNVTVTFNPSKCIADLKADEVSVEGVFGESSVNGDNITIKLLKDCMITIK